MVQILGKVGRGICVAMLVLVAGCAISLDSAAPYNQYVGRTVTLKEPMVLIADSLSSAYSRIQLVRPFEVEPGRVPETWKILGPVPAGTQLIVKKVRWIRTDNAGGWVLAICQFPEGGEVFGVRLFTYFWGDETLNRAPWEDSSVPERRDAGHHGREYHP